jgi:ergothioneine biosynthesis protein EgtB
MSGAGLSGLYREVRGQTIALCESLEPEDFVVQSMADASPTKWHLAHTSWFFETFLLVPDAPGYRVFNNNYGYLFNSYYNSLGERLARARRGLISRPSVEEVLRYREHVDRAMLDWLESSRADDAGSLVLLGLNHEQQHQELILTDILHAFASNPLRPVFRMVAGTQDGAAPRLAWSRFPEGIHWIGNAGTNFAFDNEGPRHRQLLGDFQLASRLVTNGEYRDFIVEGGYRRPELWLSDGWNACTAQGWAAPLYWDDSAGGEAGEMTAMTLSGPVPIDAAAPVSHVSFYEADAFARWAGARLPTEAEWEVAAADQSVSGNFLESGRLRPAPARPTNGPAQLFGDAWEWTSSPYVAYPGYAAAAGALGEYNGKFMCNQIVLRGGSCATPQSHIRATYRNFYPPEARWQFSGIRLARDV